MKLSVVAVAALLLGMLVPAQARDQRLRFPIKEAMEAAAASGKMDQSVPVFFSNQACPKAVSEYGTYTSNKKTNFFNKSDKQACEWAFPSAIISLQERAKAEGGNAVVSIISVYRNASFSSTTEYECGAGAVTGGVALRGRVVKL